MDATSGSISDEHFVTEVPSSEVNENNSDVVAGQEHIDKKQTDGSEIKTENGKGNSDDNGEIKVSQQNGEADDYDTTNEDRNGQDTNIISDNLPVGNGLTNNLNNEAYAEIDKHHETKGDDSTKVTDPAPVIELEMTEHGKPDTTDETAEVPSEPACNVVNVEAQGLTEREDQTEGEEIQESSEIESYPDKKEDNELEEVDDTETNADEKDTQDEAETYLVQHDAEKQVMHELIDETIVLEKDIGSLQKQLESTEKDKIALQNQVDKMTEESEVQKVTIEQLGVELKEAKMGDGEQRRMLEESQQRVQDLEGQLKRMVKDDEEKGKKLAKAVKDVSHLTDKCRQLESEVGENTQSKTCVVM